MDGQRHRPLYGRGRHFFHRREHGGFSCFSFGRPCLHRRILARASLTSLLLLSPVFLRVLRGQLFLFFFLIKLSHSIGQPSSFQSSPSRRTTFPLRRARIAGNLRQAASTERRLVERLYVISLDHKLIVLLDHQPFVSLAAGTPTAHLDQREVSIQLLAVQAEFQIAFGQHRRGFGLRPRHILPVDRYRRKRLPRAHIPYHHGSRAVVTFWNIALEIEIRNRMILHLHGQPLVRRIERRSLGHRPRLQHAFHLQAKVVMQPRGSVLLHHKPMPRLALHFRRRLRRLFKPPLSFVFLKRHRLLHLTTQQKRLAWG